MSFLLKIFNRPGLIEQAIISMLNFVILIIFSKALVPSDFAQFVILYSSISLIFLICTSILSNPILVFFCTQFRSQKYFYIKYLISSNLFLSFLLSTICLLFVDKFIRGFTFYEMILSSIIIIVWTQYELIRKVYYSLNSLYTLLVTTSLIMIIFASLSLIYFNKLNIIIGLILLLFSYLVANIGILIINRKIIKLFYLKKESNITSKSVLKVHWEYSKWTLSGSILYWIATQGYILVISKYISDVELGGFRIALNLVGIMSIFLVYFENTYTTISSKVFYNYGATALGLYIKKVTNSSALPFLGVSILTTLFAYLGILFFFDDSYSEFAYLTIIFGMYQVILGLNRPSIIGLRALNKTKHFLIGNLILFICTYLFGIFLVRKLFLLGASLTMLLSTIILTIYFILGFNTELKRNKEIRD